MARQQHLRILERGPAIWNKWRTGHDEIVPHLICAELEKVDLVGVNFALAELPRAKFNKANLMGANLSGATAVSAYFRGADFSGAQLVGTVLSNADLAGANLSLANLSGANLVRANLAGANLSHANLIGATLIDSDLTGANFSGADLSGASLIHAKVRGANFSLATFAQTIVGALDLSGAKGLDTCVHLGPSIIDHRTLAQSGLLPQVFLQGCGLPDELIRYWEERSAVVRAGGCFIHYCKEGKTLAELLCRDLQKAGTRCWFAPHDRNGGDRFRSPVASLSGQYDQLLLVLTSDCVRSPRLEKEIERTLEKEKAEGGSLLVAVAADDKVLKHARAWFREIRCPRAVLSFQDWTDHDAYAQLFPQLLNAIRA